MASADAIHVQVDARWTLHIGGGGGVHIEITYQTPPSSISLSTACDKSSLAFPMIFHRSSASVCYTELKYQKMGSPGNEARHTTRGVRTRSRDSYNS